MATVTLSTIHELTAAVGVPRVAAIEYPQGRPFGVPGDSAGQTNVLRAALELVERATVPGAVAHLPFEWPERRGQVRSDPPVPPPIATLLKRKPWLLPRLLRRDPPA